MNMNRLPPLNEHCHVIASHRYVQHFDRNSKPEETDYDFQCDWNGLSFWCSRYQQTLGTESWDGIRQNVQFFDDAQKNINKYFTQYPSIKFSKSEPSIICKVDNPHYDAQIDKPDDARRKKRIDIIDSNGRIKIFGQDLPHFHCSFADEVIERNVCYNHSTDKMSVCGYYLPELRAAVLRLIDGEYPEELLIMISSFTEDLAGGRIKKYTQIPLVNIIPNIFPRAEKKQIFCQYTYTFGTTLSRTMQYFTNIEGLINKDQRCITKFCTMCNFIDKGIQFVLKPEYRINTNYMHAYIGHHIAIAVKIQHSIHYVSNLLSLQHEIYTAAMYHPVFHIFLTLNNDYLHINNFNQLRVVLEGITTDDCLNLSVNVLKGTYFIAVPVLEKMESWQHTKDNQWIYLQSFDVNHYRYKVAVSTTPSCVLNIINEKKLYQSTMKLCNSDLDQTYQFDLHYNNYLRFPSVDPTKPYFVVPDLDFERSLTRCLKALKKALVNPEIDYERDEECKSVLANNKFSLKYTTGFLPKVHIKRQHQMDPPIDEVEILKNIHLIDAKYQHISNSYPDPKYDDNDDDDDDDNDDDDDYEPPLKKRKIVESESSC